MAAIGNPAAVQAAAAKRDQWGRERYETGRRDGEAQAEARFGDRLEGARAEHLQEIARLDERHRLNDVEIRGAAYWRGKVIGAAGGLLVGVILSIAVNAVMFSGHERAIQAGANVAQGGMTAGLAIDALQSAEEQP